MEEEKEGVREGMRERDKERERDRQSKRMREGYGKYGRKRKEIEISKCVGEYKRQGKRHCRPEGRY